VHEPLKKPEKGVFFAGCPYKKDIKGEGKKRK
jgi:hypothetical protein